MQNVVSDEDEPIPREMSRAGDFELFRRCSRSDSHSAGGIYGEVSRERASGVSDSKRKSSDIVVLTDVESMRCRIIDKSHECAGRAVLLFHI